FAAEYDTSHNVSEGRKIMATLSKRLRTYLIMGSQNCQRDPAVILKEAVQGGITAFQFREKGTGSLTGEAKRELGRQLRDICWNNDVLFLVNDDIDLAAALDADGIHVGQGDMSVEHVRKRFPHKIIGPRYQRIRKCAKVRLSSLIMSGPARCF